MNILHDHIREDNLSDILQYPTRSFTFPDLSSYNQIQLLTKDRTDDGPRYLQIDVSDTRQWLTALQNLILDEFSAGDQAGIVLLIDCGYQFGSILEQNTFLRSIYEQLCSENDKEDVKTFMTRKIVVWNDINDLGMLSSRLLSLGSNLEPKYLNQSLDYVVVSNLSIFYWEMKYSADFHELVKFHRICQKISNSFECVVISSLSFVP